MKPLYGLKANFIDKHAAAERGRRKSRRNGVMYASSASLAAAHVIGPDANKVLKAYGGGLRKGREGRKGVRVGKEREEG